MTKPQDRSLRARIIPNTENSYRRAATISTRPIRLAFVINETIAVEQLVTIIKYNCVIWGGYYNLMVPTNGKHISDHWFKSLINHDPDYIMLCGEIDDTLGKKLFDKIQPFTLWIWENSVLSNHLEDEGRVGSISIGYVLTHLYNLHRPINSTDISIVEINGESPFHFHSLAQFGLLPQLYQDYAINQLKGETRQLTVKTLADYLDNQRYLAQKITPIKLTSNGLDIYAENNSLLGLHIVLSGRKMVRDFSLFWNYRMQSSFPPQEILFLPISSLRTNQGIVELAQFCKMTVTNTNFITLASASVSKNYLAAIKENLTSQLNSSKIKYIHTKSSNFVTGKFRIYEKGGQEEVKISDDYFRIKKFLPNLQKFESYANNSRWVVDIKFEADGLRPSEYLPPKFPGSSELLSNDHPLAYEVNRGYRARLANGHLSYKVGFHPEFINGYLPQERDIFSTLIQARGFSSVDSEKSKYVQGMIGLLGDVNGLISLRNIKLQSLLREMAKGGAFNIKMMMQYFQPGKEQKNFDAMDELITNLSLNSVLLRGLNIHCPSCDLIRWYPLNIIEERMRCAGCLTELQPPIDAPFSYKLNELFSRGVNQGAIPVLLTLTFLEQLSAKSLMYLPGLIVKKPSEMDIDIIASCDSHLVLVECKDLHQSLDANVNKEIFTQLTKLVETAKELHASMVFLSTLLPSIPDNLRRRIELLNKRLKGEVIVHLLIFQDLERGYRMMPDDFSPGKQRKMQLSDFLPRVPARKANLTKEHGIRTISF